MAYQNIVLFYTQGEQENKNNVNLMNLCHFFDHNKTIIKQLGKI